MLDCPASTRLHACAIAVELDGQTYIGSFTVDGTTMLVSYASRARSVHCHASVANGDILARCILGELVDETRHAQS